MSHLSRRLQMNCDPSCCCTVYLMRHALLRHFLQVTLPIAAVDGLPVGLSFVGPPGSDEGLLQLAVKLTEALKEPH